MNKTKGISFSEIKTQILKSLNDLDIIFKNL